MYCGPPSEFLGLHGPLETTASMAYLANSVCQALVFEHPSNKELQTPVCGQLGYQKGRLRQKLKPHSISTLYRAGKNPRLPRRPSASSHPWLAPPFRIITNN